MLEVIIAYLNGILTQYDFANEYYGLAEKTEQGDVVFPAVYCGKDELKRIEFEREVAYHRLRSDINYSQSTDGVSGCEDYVTISYPLTVVAYVKRDRQNDTNYSPSRLAESIATAIKQTPFGNLMAAADAEDVQVEINNTITSAKTVWENEHENIEFAARHDHVLISVEYTVTVSASQSCLKKWECFETVTVTPPTIVISGRDWDSLPGKPICLTSDDLCSLPMWNITSTDISHWNEAYSNSHPAVTLGTPNGLSLNEATQVLSLGLASANTNGALSSTDWSTFNNKVTSVNLATGVVTLSVANTGSALQWSGTQLQIPTATNSITGLLSAADRTSFAAKENVLTFTTGLTRSVNTVTNDLLTGKAGGQNIYGGTASGENLVLKGSNNATPGRVQVDGKLNVGTTAIPPMEVDLNVYKTTSAQTSIMVLNTNTSAVKTIELINNASGTNNFYLQLVPSASAINYDGVAMANWGRISILAGAAGLMAFVLTNQDFRIGADGKTRILARNNDLTLGHSTGQNIGVYGVTPVARQLVPLGSSTDTVITALQNIGWFRQS